jgi:hypothetical protein
VVPVETLGGRDNLGVFDDAFRSVAHRPSRDRKLEGYIALVGARFRAYRSVRRIGLSSTGVGYGEKTSRVTHGERSLLAPVQETRHQQVPLREM